MQTHSVRRLGVLVNDAQQGCSVAWWAWGWALAAPVLGVVLNVACRTTLVLLVSLQEVVGRLLSSFKGCSNAVPPCCDCCV